MSEKITEMEDRLLDLSEEERSVLQYTKLELGEIMQKRSQGILFRSKATWWAEGEKNTKYFWHLEKARYNAKTCVKIVQDDGSELVNHEQILNAQKNFYQELYTADPLVQFMLEDNVQVKVPQNVSASCEENFTKAELDMSVKQLKNNSCPGPDGFPIEIYKTFPVLREMLYDAVLEAYQNSLLHESARKGVLNLIPKGQKDPRFLKNLRPISLLNSDYKIVEKMIANRMTPVLEQLIHEDQKGFLPNRRIAANIRKILEVVRECDRTTSEGIILSCDYMKCFDRVETKAVIGAMKYFGFSDLLINWVSIIYTQFSFRVQNNGYFSTKIDVTRSVRQGGPASNVLFLVVAELLANNLHADDQITGLYVKEIIQFLNQYADDMDVCSEFSEESLSQILTHIDEFGKSTGFKLNYDKTTIYRVGSLANTDAKLYSARKLPWTNNSINILGVEIMHDDISTLEKNYNSIVSKVDQIINSWTHRNLSLIGKIQVVNTLIASLFVYKMSVLPPIPDYIVKKIESLIQKYLWNGHKPNISLGVLQNNKDMAGLRLVNLRTKDRSLKASWVKILMDGAYDRRIVHNTLHPGLQEVLWSCNLYEKDVNNVVKYADAFWCSVLKAWCLYHYSDKKEEAVDQIIWLNSDIRVNNAPIWWETPAKCGLMYVSQLVDTNTHEYLSFEEVSDCYCLTILQFNTLKVSIPKAWKTATAEYTDSKFATFNKSPHPARLVYQLINEVADVSGTNARCMQDLGNVEFDIVEEVQFINKSMSVAKYQSFQYRLLHRAIIMNIHLQRWGIVQDENSSLCELAPETYRHLFEVV